MVRAGSAIAELSQSITLDRPGHILTLVGPGNNGGDALVAARLLHERGLSVQVALLEAAEKFSGDARNAWDQWAATGGITLQSPTQLDFKSVTLIIDGLFGIGLKSLSSGQVTRPLPKRARAWIEQVNRSGLPVLAVDVPTGLDADTGYVVDPAACIRASHTLSFIGDKPGLHTADGPDYCGHIRIDALGLNIEPDSEAGQINDPTLFQPSLPSRRLNSHKGQFGSTGIIGGASGMVGAALLAARMALYAGSGRVYVRLLAHDAPSFDVNQPELMLRHSLEGLNLQAHVLGPGLGQSDASFETLEQMLSTPASLVLDADALNGIAAHAKLRERVSLRNAPTVLTPHPLEAARLLDTDAQTVQSNRIKAAQRLAHQYQSIVILKGAGSIIADPKGQWVINTTGNPALATGGTGDVLAGVTGALLAQGMPAWNAALAATWIHGKAADELRDQGIGPVGLSASELIPEIRKVLNQCLLK